MVLDLVDFIGGSVGGAVGLTLAQPFDTIKVRLQYGKLSLFETTRELYRAEGFRGFYRGYVFPLFTTGINNAAFFGVSSIVLKFTDQDPLMKTAICDRGYLEMCYAAMFGAFAQVMCACPVEMVKIRQQVENTSHTVFQILRQIVERNGFRGLYRGLPPMLCSDIPSNMLYVVLYEKVYNVIAGRPDGDRNLIQTCLSGGIAGTLAFLPMVPFDVTQTRLMADKDNKYKGMIHCMQVAVRKEGFRSLYRGAGVAACRLFPMYGGVFLGFEETKQLYRRYCRKD